MFFFVFVSRARTHFRFIIDELTGRLTITEVKRTDEGDIKCIAENRAGKVQKSAYLKVSHQWVRSFTLSRSMTS